MKLPFILSSASAALLAPTTVNAASIALDNPGHSGEPAPTMSLEILHKLQLGGQVDRHLVVTQFNGGLFERENPQVYDWFTASINSEIDWTQLGTPVPEPSGTLIFGIAGLALSLRRRR